METKEIRTDDDRLVMRAVMIPNGLWRKCCQIKKETGCPIAETVRRALEAYLEPRKSE